MEAIPIRLRLGELGIPIRFYRVITCAALQNTSFLLRDFFPIIHSRMPALQYIHLLLVKTALEETVDAPMQLMQLA
jgi:hypothetical protein